jgi:hypothetical protein
MAKLYRSREGPVTAIDTKTQLTSLGSETAPGPLLVPAEATALAAVIVTYGADYAAAQDGALILRLEGPGLPEGSEAITIGATGVQVATGGNAARKAMRVPLDIPVTAANEVLVFAELVGEDIGSVTVGATLEFTK